jgi:hypothetical protein
MFNDPVFMTTFATADWRCFSVISAVVSGYLGEGRPVATWIGEMRVTQFERPLMGSSIYRTDRQHVVLSGPQ